MKLIKLIPVLMVVFYSSCTQTTFDPLDPQGFLGQKLDSTITIDSLIRRFDTIPGLFGAAIIDTTVDVIFNGIVTSTDMDGNVYKYITVQEEFPGGKAMKISVDVSGLSGILPPGQRVSVKCNGLYIGKYAESEQLGVYYYNSEKGRVEPGRIPLPVALEHIKAYGMPDPAAIKVDTMSIADILKDRTTKKLINKIVCIRNAYFTGRGADYGAPKNITDAEMIFAPSTNGIGYPQSREIQDGTGSVFISTSEYAKFASKPIPLSVYRGNITALVGWYNDKDAVALNTKIYHQLTIRTLNDLGKGFEGYLQSINKMK